MQGLVANRTKGCSHRKKTLMKEDKFMKEYLGDIYDAMYARIKDDIPFYKEYAIEAGEVLEVGIGTGRIGFELAKAGIKLWGIDLDESMLEQSLKKLSELPSEVQKRIIIDKQDMRDFNLDHEFNLIIVPFRAFQHMLTPEDQKQALACFRKHLTSEGKLIIDLFDPCYDYLCEKIVSNIRGPLISKIDEFRHPQTDNKIIVTGHRQNQPENQIDHS